MKISSLALVALGAVALVTSLPSACADDRGDVAPKPLFRDPTYNGAADPIVVWNPSARRWWMFYTSRRANVPGLSGVAWVHGTQIGIAESVDGAAWRAAGTADIQLPPEFGGKNATLWAPEIVRGDDGTHHLFLTVVPGVFENWQHPRTLVHLTSTDLRKWTYHSALTLASDRVIDASVHRLPDGTWRMWYNNERDHKSIYYADSPDLVAWTDHGKVTGVGERPGEGPFVFDWKGHSWMLVDLWAGLGVYRSDDQLRWTVQSDNLLGLPGHGPDDGVNGGHPGVVVSNDRAFLFYFTHPGRAGTIKADDEESLDLRRSSIQVVELFEQDGRLTCDRDQPTHIRLVPPVIAASTAAPKAAALVSPDGRLAVDFYLNAAGAPRYNIRREGRAVLQESRLGLVRDDADFTQELRLLAASAPEPVQDSYELLTAKRRLNTYRANRQVFHLQTATGRAMDIIFQVSNDGVAFRYFFPETNAATHRLSDEVSSFHFLPGTRAWLQPMSEAKSGWKQVNPGYEEYYEKDIPAGTPSPIAAGWVYPALFRSGDTWLLVSEGSLPRNYCGTRLRAESPDGEYTVGFPDSRENFQNGPVNPASTLPWLTPWRLIVVGSLKTIVESTLGTDLADPPAQPADPSIEPGKAAWSWPLLGDSKTVYEVQKQFIDYAAAMGWRYCLIDALWDAKIGYEKIKELADYGRGKNVRLLLWYNSAGDWNTTPQTPRNLLLAHESRVREFDRLKALGIAGLKIDFFGGDGQSMIGYYHDLLEDAAPYGFLMNFHGATLPRGWQRTYPHLMTMEAVRGLEYVTFEQKNADQEATHAAMLPFARNVFDPMDFTPMVLDHINRIERRTTSAFELALAVLFTSGIQHYAETPDGLAKAPGYVRDFLQGVPGVWDDIRFLDGEPGKFVALARRGGRRWYVAGINAEATARTLTLDLAGLSPAGSGTLIADGDGGNLSFRTEKISVTPGQKLTITLPPHGGFVLVLE